MVDLDISIRFFQSAENDLQASLKNEFDNSGLIQKTGHLQMLSKVVKKNFSVLSSREVNMISNSNIG